MRREVGAEIEVEIIAATTLEFQIAVAPHPGAEVFESLRFVLNGRPIRPVEVSGVHGNRIHKFDAAVGTLKVDYAATIVGQTAPAPVIEYDQSMYLRPSRYAEADKFYGFAATEFGNDGDSANLLEHLSSQLVGKVNDPASGAATSRRILTAGVTSRRRRRPRDGRFRPPLNREPICAARRRTDIYCYLSIHRYLSEGSSMADDNSGPAEGIKGVVEDVKGRAKEAVGTVTGRDNLTEEGKAQQDKAEAQRDAAKKEAEAEKARGEAKVEETRQQSHQ